MRSVIENKVSRASILKTEGLGHQKHLLSQDDYFHLSLASLAAGVSYMEGA